MNTSGEQVVLGHAHLPEAGPSTQAKSLQFVPVVLAVLKCALCPACLSVFGGLFAGTRMYMLLDESFFHAFLVVAVVLDVVILWVAFKHHQSRWPLVCCVAGAVLAAAGHFTIATVEFVGLALIIVAAVSNVVLMRRHRATGGGACCAHA